MYIKEAEDLFNRVELNTPLEINNYEYKIEIINNKIVLKKYPLIYKSRISPYKTINKQLDEYGFDYELDHTALAKIKDMKNNSSLNIGKVVVKQPEEFSDEYKDLPPKSFLKKPISLKSMSNCVSFFLNSNTCYLCVNNNNLF
jgi:hypothetical protein